MPTMHGGDPDSLGRIDHYDLLRKLGGGGFGVVYLARDSVSGIEVALKTLHPLLKTNAEEMDALREKFRLVHGLTHPNIAKALVLHPVRDVNIWDETARKEMRLSPGDSVMVMDYAPGVTLSRWRRQFPDGIVPPDLALEIGRQLASALDYAHGERIVHRDIKPGNIVVETIHGLMVEGSNSLTVAAPDPQTVRPSDRQTKLRVRLLDFGLAAEIRSSMSRVSTETGDTSGTRPYMAPEQWLGKKQDGRTDQYALACVLYELLSGAPPFAGVFETGDPAVMMATVEKRAPEQISNIPVGVNAALRCALSKDPAARFPNCAAFVEALSRGMRSGRLAGTARPTKRWFAAAAAVAVAVAGALWFTQSHGENGAAEGGASPPGEPQSEAIRAAEQAREEAVRKAEAERKAREEAEGKLAEERKAAEEARLAAEHKNHERGKVQLWAGGPYWAETNIGANKPEDSGLYFWWGDTVGYRREGSAWVASDGSSRNFSFGEKNTPTLGKDHATLRREGWITQAGVLAPQHDASQAHWGRVWRMPTQQELADLNSKCDWRWTTRDGVNGYVVRGRGAYANASIFLPAAGTGLGTSLDGAGSYGYFWSSVPDADSYDGSWCLGFNSGDHDVTCNERGFGQPVRPVQGFTE